MEKGNYLHEIAWFLCQNTIGGASWHQTVQSSFDIKRDILLRSITLYPNFAYPAGNNQYNANYGIYVKLFPSPVFDMGHQAIVSQTAQMLVASNGVPAKYIYDDVYVKAGQTFVFEVEMYGSNLDVIVLRTFINAMFEFKMIS